MITPCQKEAHLGVHCWTDCRFVKDFESRS